jgi:hypothetical protein
MTDVTDAETTESGARDGAEGEYPFSDAELTALALGEASGDRLPGDAVPLSLYLGQDAGLLPQWYMPPVMARRCRGWRRPVILGLVAAFLVIEALGLCSVFGQLVIG